MRWMQAFLLGIAVLLWGFGLCSGEEAGDGAERLRRRLKAVGVEPCVASDEWGGPIAPEEARKLGEALYRLREADRQDLEADLAALDAQAFAAFFEPDALKQYGEAEQETLFHSVLARGKAPEAVLAELERAAGEEGRPMGVRMAAACAAARLGRGDMLPFLLFGARVASEMVTGADLLQEALPENRVDERTSLGRFSERWRAVLEEVSAALLRLVPGDKQLPKLEPGDWGAISVWESWWKEGHEARRIRGRVTNCFGDCMWLSRTVGETAGLGGQMESIVTETVKEYVRKNPRKEDTAGLLRGVVGADYRRGERGGRPTLFVNVGGLIREYVYDPEGKSWRCERGSTLLE